LVSNLDIMPTMLDVLGIGYSDAQLDGRSLLRLDRDDTRVIYVRRVLSTSTYAAINGKLKLVNRQGQLFLFDLANDPDEQVNRLGQIRADELYFALEQFGLRMRLLQEGKDVSQTPPLVSDLRP